MTLSRAFNIVCVVACLVTFSCAWVQSCAKSRALSEMTAERDRLASEKAELSEALAGVRKENDRLRDLATRAEEAVKTAIHATEEAHVQQIECLEAIDSLPADWLQCAVPDGVQDMFAGYCH